MTHYFKFCIALSLLEIFYCNSELCPEIILNTTQESIETEGEDLCRIWIIQPPENTILTLSINRLVVNNCNDVFFEIRNPETNYNACIRRKKAKLLEPFRKFPIHVTFFSEKKASLAFEFSSRNSTLCPDNDFQCLDKSNCYNYHQICDGKIDCQDHSDEICDNCLENLVSCSVDGIKCFHPKIERCNGYFDCPKGEDEFNCTTNCMNAISCWNPTECFQPHQRCNGIKDCSEGTDETNCSSISCDQRLYFLCNDGSCIGKNLIGDGKDDCEDGSDEKSKHKAIEIILLLVFVVLFVSSLFIVHRWCNTRRNINQLIRNPPEFPLPPFRGPGEYAGYQLQFSDCDYRHAGEIYEGFVQSRREGRHRRARIHRTTNSCIHNVTPRSSIPNLDNSTLAALASLGIPPEFCVGLDSARKEVERGSRASTEETDSLRYTASIWGSGGDASVRAVNGEETI